MKPGAVVRAVGRVVTLVLLGCGPAANAPKERVVIPQGATVHSIADTLAAHRIISSTRWFRTLARVGGYDRRLRSGPYELLRGQGSRGALRALTSGRALLTRFTVPEGFTLREMAEVAESTLRIPHDEFLARTRDTALLREFAVPAASFEGFLKPETYLFAEGVSAETVLRAMAGAATSEWDSSFAAAAARQGLDRLTATILASLVEGEAKVEQDRPLVAAVYRNRLRIGMPLQADPTVQYAIEQARGQRKTRLYDKDYGIVSPYNTYLNSGLPPGPVGAPGRRSLEAVVWAPSVPFLYFVAGPGGAHVFTRTYGEHLRAIRRIRQQ